MGDWSTERREVRSSRSLYANASETEAVAGKKTDYSVHTLAVCGIVGGRDRAKMMRTGRSDDQRMEAQARHDDGLGRVPKVEKSLARPSFFSTQHFILNLVHPLAMDANQASRGGKRPGNGQPGRGTNKFSRGGRGRGRNVHSGPPPPRAQDSDASQPSTPAPEGEEDPTVNSHLSETRFDSLKGHVDDRVLSAIPFERMSVVQAATISDAIQGYDVLAQAKTGTGKTVAFLLPAIQRLITTRRSPGNIYTLILSPTRELAMQIEKEAKTLLRNVPDIGVQHVVGGTNMNAETKRLNNQRCDILVATPGRLLDHINNGGLREKLSDLKILVLDEADRMLDMGFRNELEKIKANLPDRRQKPRQSLLFSATYPSR